LRESFNARPQMLNLATNEKLVRSTGISFAVVVTVMHGLNIARMTNAVLSQAWSVIEIIGFFFTVTTSAQLHHPLAAGLPRKAHPSPSSEEEREGIGSLTIERSDVSLP
jgi:hypothetical protein